MFVKRLMVGAAFLMCACGVIAGDFEDGMVAFNKKDFSVALVKFKSLAEQGNANAQYNIGVMYRQGLGVTQDYAEALRWYKLAAVQGIAGAQFNAGVFYEKGRGVAINFAEAMRWYKLAAEQGYVDAQSNMGILYGKGQGVPQDFVRAHMWVNLAATNGDADAVQNRNYAESKMTAKQITEAQKLARECLARNYKNC